MIVVSDASAIIALSAIARLELLQTLYQTIYIPDAVYQEIVSVEETKPGMSELLAAPWILTRRVHNRPLVVALHAALDGGEAEAIALATEIPADLLIMDERRDRRLAVQQGVAVLGLLGVLVAAKQAGLVPTPPPLLDVLRTTAGFHMSLPLYHTVLQTVGETP